MTGGTDGGGDSQSCESPAKSRLRPVQLPAEPPPASSPSPPPDPATSKLTVVTVMPVPIDNRSAKVECVLTGGVEKSAVATNEGHSPDRTKSPAGMICPAATKAVERLCWSTASVGVPEHAIVIVGPDMETTPALPSSPLYQTRNVASITPSSDAKKNCTPFAACAFVSVVGLLGLSALEPATVDVNVRRASFTNIVDVTTSPELGRSGVT